MLEFDEATKNFGPLAALDACSFTAQPGRLTGFLGPNGAGKTTAMRAVFGLVELDAGAVRWRGAEIGGVERTRFGYMPEERGLYPRMRVREQLVYLGRLCGTPDARVRGCVDGWLERLGLADRAGDRLDALSHGNQQRVQLIAALVNEPDLLVLDEPFAGLDPIAIGNLGGLLAEIASAGATVLFSSHQLDLVEDLCEDVVIIDQGRVVLAGHLADLRAAVPQRFLEIRYRGATPDWSALGAAEIVESTDGHACFARAHGQRSDRGDRAHSPDDGRRFVHVPAPDAVGAVPPGGRGMNGVRQAWLVAVREMRERGRSRAFLASMVVMVVVVAGIIVLPSVLGSSGGTKDIGVTGTTSTDLPRVVRAQSEAVGIRSRVHVYETVTAGQQAVRDGKVDVLVVDGQRLEWRRQADEQLRAVVTGSIQLVAIRDRAAAAGISPDKMLAIVAPVRVTNLELGRVAGRTPDDETAALIMTVLLFMSIATYGAMVLSGVVEEKTSRVVEVLLARMPARSLLAGKVTGIGLLGLAQIGLTALVAFIALRMTDSVDVPAVRGPVLAWVVVWFVLGYALYATVFGALGALASRPEDAQSVAGPISVVLIAGYFVSFAAIGSPSTAWAKAVSYFPATAPLAMPNRIAMGATAWWEPVAAVAITVVAIAALVQFGGRVYTGGILHSGPTLKVREAWQGTSPTHAQTVTTTPPNAVRPRPSRQEPGDHEAVATGTASVRRIDVAVIGGALLVAAVVFLLSRDAVIGIAVGAGGYAIANRVVKARTRRADRHYSHR